MGRKGGKKKGSQQKDLSSGPPDQEQTGQSSSTPPSRVESQTSSQPCQSSQSAPGGRGQGRGRPLHQDGQQQLLPSAFGDQDQRRPGPREDVFQQQQQQQQDRGHQGQQQGQWVNRGRGGTREQGRGGGFGRGQSSKSHAQQQQKYDQIGEEVLQQPQQQKPSTWGQRALQPAQPTTAPKPQQPTAPESSFKQEAASEQVTKQMSEVSLGQKQAASELSSAKVITKRPIEQLGIPKRKNPMKAGTQGRPIEIYTNMMKIKFGKNFKPNVIHYDVAIDPDKPKYLMRHVFKEAQKKLFPNRWPAFDGKKNAFSAGQLPIKNPETTEVTVFNEDGKEKQYKITFKVANELDLSWLLNVGPGLKETERNQISLQALDIILRSAPALKATTIGRSFFTPPEGRVMSLGGGMDVWVGLFQSAILGWKPLLNVDVAHKGFPTPQTVLDLIKQICGVGDSQGGDRQGPPGRQQYGRGGYEQAPTQLTVDLIERYREDITKFLKGLKVVYEIPKQATSRRTHRVNGLVQSPKQNSFEHNGKRMTILQYYRLEKKYNIEYPDFPCLWVGSTDKNIHVPVELCKIVAGQATHKKLNEKQTSSMIKFAATGTEERRRKIMDAFNKMDHNSDDCMKKEFGISVSGEFEKVSARVLEPPALAYNNEKPTARVLRGVWKADKFFQPSQAIANDNSWTILNLNRNTRDNDLFQLYEELRRNGGQLGMTIGKPATPFLSIQPRNDIRELRAFFEEQKRKNLRLIVVIIPEMKGPYSKVKQISELSVGILTQCMKGRTLQRLNPATTSNILLKINAKLNGINHMIAPNNRNLPNCLKRPGIIVGADVTHPSPDAQDIPSIAAVAASHDPCAFKYNIEIRLQPPRMEIIQDLAEIMKIQLLYFYRVTKHKPERIIFYRDGVSEGQFSQIMDAELVAIRKACSSLHIDYKPLISFLVVQKRHHTRFFPVDPRETDDKNCNVRAGTIVDTEITHPSDIDFYLVSHASIQGTARPTKYRCLWDDSDMSENEIEHLTYFLCHMFSRCTRSVSYPTPTYYAHLAAFRARALTQDVNINLNNLAQEQLRKLTLKEDVSKNTPMFFV